MITIKKQIQHCLQSNLNVTSLQVISKEKKSKIPPRHKSFNFFQKLTGIDRKKIQRWVLDKDLCFSTPYKRYFNGLLPSNTISNSQNSSRSRKTKIEANKNNKTMTKELMAEKKRIGKILKKLENGPNKCKKSRKQ